MGIRQKWPRPGTRLVFVVAAVVAIPVRAHSAEPLETVREAFRASSTGLTSGSGKGVYRFYEEVDGAGWVLKTDADIATYFDGKKYFVELRFQPEFRGICCRRIMYNGTSIRTAWFSPGMLTRGQVAEIPRDDLGDGLSRPVLAEFPWDASRLSSNVCHVDRMIENVTAARIDIKRTIEGDLVGTHPVVNFERAHVRLEWPKRFGFNIAKLQMFVAGEERPATDYRVEWKQSHTGLWYVRSLYEEFLDPGQMKRFRRVMKYTEFEPNAKIDPGVFTKAFLEMPLGDRVSEKPASADN